MVEIFAVAFLVFLFTLILFPASTGISFGIRKKYVKVLRWMFEYGRRRIQEHENPPEEDIIADFEKEEATPTPTPNPKPNLLTASSLGKLPRNRSFRTFRREFHVSDGCDFAVNAINAIAEDEVTKYFTASELGYWNFLTRTNKNYQFINWKLTLLWVLGFIIRYFVLLPMRIIICSIAITWLLFTVALFGCLPKFRYRAALERWCTLIFYRIFGRALSASITIEQTENRAKSGICVANHTSPVDVAMLSVDNCFALVGQKHSGFLGAFQALLSLCQSSHIWFERTEANDRVKVLQRLKAHVNHPDNNPILIFPEGTCINNSGVFMFKKGSFEVGGTIYPVAIKYDPVFCDPFWNSSQQSAFHYFMRLLTSWALVCSVVYLPPTRRRENEEAIDFAGRVKNSIVETLAVADISWDGMVKKPGSFKKESMKDKKAERQAEYSATLNVPSPPSRNVVADDDDDDQSPLRKYPPRNKKVRATFNFKID
ncbi:glycerol-3-phosphate acyltransferase 3-like [Oscarella lobularis]|uniref:glycerol-3-phosphate acyltransferase 3-like n=1 Tax=Oscarella lobularis TaxID=121494 RepID=UPI0033136E80